MAEENKPSNADNFKLEATTNDQSKITQIGKIETQNVNVYLTTENQDCLDSSLKEDSPSFFSDENPYKSLSYCVERKEEISQLKKLLNNKDITLIGIEGIGGIGKSTPTRSILHRSAASLAVECGEVATAERLIAIALSGNPPQEIAEELKDLFVQINIDKYCARRGMVFDAAK